MSSCRGRALSALSAGLRCTPGIMQSCSTTLSSHVAPKDTAPAMTPPSKPLDLYSGVASEYAKYRPTYPDALYEFIFSHCPQPRRRAWDVATGSGQAAVKIAAAFESVIATDISEKQLAHAVSKPNITYAATAAKLSDYELQTIIGPPGSIDLVTIAQGYHWFDFDYFPQAVKKVLRPDGVVAVWTYGLVNVTPEFDSVIWQWYEKTWPYWEPQRKFVDAGYSNIPFPFAPLPGFQSQGTGPFRFTSELHWSLHDFLGYLSSWSPVATAKKQGLDLLDDGARAGFQRGWGDPDVVKPVRFPISLLMGTVSKD